VKDRPAAIWKGQLDNQDNPLTIAYLQTPVILYTQDMVVSIQVLVQRELEDAGAGLPQDDGAIRKEEDPDVVPAFAVLGNDLLSVLNPVQVLPPYCGAVVDAQDINVLNLETSSFNLSNDPPK